tara:strand:+ start:116 stop:520 length:405 start_codon:yes stop_codon:yes gene_type:complete
MIDTANLVQEVIDGNCSPYEATYFIKEEIKKLKEHLEIVHAEAQNQSIYEDKTFEKDGFKMEKRNGRKVWNFKGCESYKIAKDNLTEIENDLKDNFNQWEKGNTVTNEDGVIMEVPKVTYTKEVLIIKKVKDEK